MDKPATKAVVVIGAQWGDEGKGKVVDYVASSFDYIARYAGGHNAGHTVIFDGHRYVLQLIPSGILRPGKKAVIGPGTVVDPAALVAELENLKKSGIEVRGRLFLSNRAHLIFPYHREMDKAAEQARGAAAGSICLCCAMRKCSTESIRSWSRNSMSSIPSRK